MHLCLFNRSQRNALSVSFQSSVDTLNKFTSLVKVTDSRFYDGFSFENSACFMNSCVMQSTHLTWNKINGSYSVYFILFQLCRRSHTHTRLMALCPGLPWVSRYQKSGFYWSKRQWVAVASAGPYASLHCAPDRQPHQQPTTQFFTGQMPFLLPYQQRQSTEGKRRSHILNKVKWCMAYDNVLWRNKRLGRPNAWCNNHVLSCWDVIGCNSFASWILMIAWNTQDIVIFYFSWSEHVE